MNRDYAKIVNALADAVKELNVETPSESSAAEPLAAAAAAAAAEHGAMYQKRGRTTTLGQSAGLAAAAGLTEFLYGGYKPPPVPPAVPDQQPNAPAQPNKKNVKKVNLSEAASVALSAAAGL
jgi:hypothetical protein